eukprot:TRINITY_DN16366_c0_g1_i21.p3 TRINITY_DN16366_c0_g1~~TRINITY_DN16366_c0_g1_i21.p3  ORF type:complete len:226 (+),score=-15.33 TRINITY_DN16366_c0_g1_i21:85-678(+)
MFLQLHVTIIVLPNAITKKQIYQLFNNSNNFIHLEIILYFQQTDNNIRNDPTQAFQNYHKHAKLTFLLLPLPLKTTNTFVRIKTTQESQLDKNNPHSNIQFFLNQGVAIQRSHTPLCSYTWASRKPRSHHEPHLPLFSLNCCYTILIIIIIILLLLFSQDIFQDIVYKYSNLHNMLLRKQFICKIIYKYLDFIRRKR